MAKLSEVLFVETLRRYISELPSEQNWLAGARDPEVGKALALLQDCRQRGTEFVGVIVSNLRPNPLP
jgi:hypothetical protein